MVVHEKFIWFINIISFGSSCPDINTFCLISDIGDLCQFEAEDVPDPTPHLLAGGQLDILHLLPDPSPTKLFSPFLRTRALKPLSVYSEAPRVPLPLWQHELLFLALSATNVKIDRVNAYKHCPFLNRTFSKVSTVLLHCLISDIKTTF